MSWRAKGFRDGVAGLRAGKDENPGCQRPQPLERLAAD